MLERVTDSDSKTLATYSYLADGTKIEATNAAGNGYTYLGSLIYQKTPTGLKLEGTGFSAGRILKTASGYAIRYYVADYQGSIRSIVDEQGNILEQNDYYPFGSRRDNSSFLRSDNRWLYNSKESQEFANLNVLDYGARMYDPLIGRWFCADPAMQLMNPYVFCGNNPIVYVDENGDIFVLSFISGFIRGLVQGKNPWKTGWQGVTNSATVIGGLFAGNFKQIASRFLWELPQTVLGFTSSLLLSGFGLAYDVDYYGGATVVNSEIFGSKAGTMGSYILGGKSLAASPDNKLFQHEYGHYLQSMETGPLYLGIYALPSAGNMIFNNKGHKTHYAEQDANARALLHWEKKFPGFAETRWHFDANPIRHYKIGKPFENSRAALTDLILINIHFKVESNKKDIATDDVEIVNNF